MESPRPPIAHVVLIDGTLATLTQSNRSSLSLIYELLTGPHLHALPAAHPPQIRVHYAPGEQWERWRKLPDLAMGRTLELHINRSYAWLSQHWQPGDQIFLIGYSRGAFGVRSLAGMIDRIGLLRSDMAKSARIQTAWRLYREQAEEGLRTRFREAYCHPSVNIRMIGVFDTVMALGLRLPLLWMLTAPRFRFHDEQLGSNVEHAFQALALDETRAIFQPVLWNSLNAETRIEQMWFRGAHPDIGGQLNGLEYARPLANIPLVWMLEHAQNLGLPLPSGWQERFPQDATAPSIGSWRSWGKAFLARAPRLVGRDPTEHLHTSVPLPYSGPALLTGQLAASGPARKRRRPLPGPQTRAQDIGGREISPK